MVEKSCILDASVFQDCSFIWESYSIPYQPHLSHTRHRYETTSRYCEARDGFTVLYIENWNEVYFQLNISYSEKILLFIITVFVMTDKAQNEFSSLADCWPKTHKSKDSSSTDKASSLDEQNTKVLFMYVNNCINASSTITSPSKNW